MNTIVDLQGFKTDFNEFIVKEIAVQCDKHVMVMLFMPPYPFNNLTSTEKKQVRWIERNRNVIWEDGFIPYSLHKPYIKELLSKNIIYVKGLEKVKWLRDILDENNKNNKHRCIYNLDDFKCPSLISLHLEFKSCLDVYQCMYHSNICALKNVNCIHKWNLANKCF